MKKRKTKSNNGITLGIYVFFFLGIFSFFFSIFQVLDSNDIKYDMMSKINKIENLKIENEKLEMKIAKLKTSQNLKQLAVNLNMVNVSDVSYVSLGGDSVVINR